MTLWPGYEYHDHKKMGMACHEKTCRVWVCLHCIWNVLGITCERPRGHLFHDRDFGQRRILLFFWSITFKAQKKRVGDDSNPFFVQSFFEWLSSLYLAGTQAAGADMELLCATVNLTLNALYVRIPNRVASSMRVAYVITKMYSLATNITLSHPDTSVLCAA